MKKRPGSLKPRKRFKGPSSTENLRFLGSAFRLLIAIIILGALRPAPSWTGEVLNDSGESVTTSFDRDRAHVGDLVWLTFDCRLPDGARLTETPEIRGLNNLTIVKTERIGGQIKIQLLVDRINPFEVGPFSITYLDETGKKRTLDAGPVSLIVSSNLGDSPAEAQLRPIQGIIPIKSLWLKYLPWVAAFFGLLCVAICLLWWLKRRRRRLALHPEFPPHVRARKLIEELASSGLFERGDFKPFYFRFSEILRHYMEEIRGFPAAEFTTEEIAAHLRAERDQRILPLLRTVDLVKFADAVPTPAKKNQELDMALSYIEDTSPASEDGVSEDDAPEASK